MFEAIFSNILSILWIGMIVIFSIAEFSTAALVSIWFVIGSLAGFATSLFTDNFYTQLTVFAVVSLVSFALAYPMVKKLRKKPLTPTNADMLIGKEVLVTQDITPKVSGRVDVNGISYMAKSLETISKDSLCEIIDLQGSAVVVKAVKETVTV